MLSERTKKILHVVRTLEPADRFTLTSRLIEPGFGEAGIEQALYRMARAGLLDSELKYNYKQDATRDRRVYLLGPKGKAFFGMESLDLRDHRNMKRVLQHREGWNIHHDCGVSRFLAYLLNCHDKGYCRVKVQRESLRIQTSIGRTNPDAHLKINDRGLFLEYERHNNYSRAVLHAERYWKAYQDELIDDPVVFVAQHGAKLKALSERIHLKLGETGNYFRFLSEEDFDLFNPSKLTIEQLIEPIV